MPRQDSLPRKTADVASAVSEFLSGLGTPHARMLVALSGGPDSVALLAATSAEAARRGLVVVACWVDHALRSAAELADEEAFVRGLCAELGVELIVQRAERGRIERAARLEGGVESAARTFRYAALERARTAASCDIVLTGHTSDDVAETMVMRFCTGSGAAGLRGIPAVTGAVHRPLLGVSKAEILAYLDSTGRTYRVDSTNLSDDYLRNRVRHEVMPVLRSVFPSLGAALATVGAKARLDEEALESMADGLVRASGDAGACLDAVAFDAAPVAVRTRALFRLGATAGTSRLPWRLVLAAASSTRAQGRLASGAGVEFVREDGRIVARAVSGSHGSRSDPDHAKGAGMTGFGFIAGGSGEYRIGKAGVCRIYSRGQPPGLRLDSFSWPLWVRSRRAGDSILTCGGLKMVDALVAELGVQASCRNRVPIVEDAAGIVAVLAEAHGGRDVYRRNDSLATVPADGFLVVDLKGVAFTDAV